MDHGFGTCDYRKIHEIVEPIKRLKHLLPCMAMAQLESTMSSLRNPVGVLGLLFTFFLFTLVSSCDNDDFQIPEPPSFDWKGAIYQNPIPVDQIQEPDCDTIWHEEYVSYRKSGDPIIWKIKLNKSRRDMIAYISYVPDLEAGQDEPPGHYTLCIKDLISGEVTLVDEMWQGFHLGFDFAGDYLFYEKNFEGYLYNWKAEKKEKVGVHIDHPSLSPDVELMSYHDLDINSKGGLVIRDIDSRDLLFSTSRNRSGGEPVWLSNNEVIIDSVAGILKLLRLNIDTDFQYFKGPFGGGVGLLVGLSEDKKYLYGNSYSIVDLDNEINLKFREKTIPENCSNRSLTNFFILPDNTFMMRKTYYINDHEKRTVYPECHWHLFDADGSNERRVELQL